MMQRSPKLYGRKRVLVSTADSCPEEDVIDEYVLNRLSIEERARLEAHFGSCQDCSTTFAETLMLASLLRMGIAKPVPQRRSPDSDPVIHN